MKVQLEGAPLHYSQGEEDQFRTKLVTELDRALAKGEDVQLVNDERLILKSPDGTPWSITVDDAGVISATDIS